MATSLATRPAVNAKSTPADPWLERPAYAVPVAALTFGVRVRHKVIPGTWKVVREATRLDSTSRYHVRVREQAADRSLFGPVLSWRIDEVAAIVTDEPKAEPADTIVEIVPPSSAPPADTFDASWYAASRAVARGDASWMPPASLVEAIVRRDAVRHELARLGATLPPDGDGPTPPADPYAGHRGKLAVLAEAEDAVRREGQNQASVRSLNSPAPCCSSCADGAARDAFEDIAESGATASRDAEDESWRYGPQDDGGGGWDAYDDERWTTSEAIKDADSASLIETPARSLAEQVDDHARSLRAEGSPLGDLLAERAESLAAEIRYLDASNVAQYRDRREAALDAARDAAEARMASRCC